jgi:5-methyltetrahydrofolate--homocysteine methyltransferase
MEDLTKAMSEMMEDETMALTRKYLEQGESPMVIFDAYKEAMVIIGKRFEEGVYFVPELILAGEMMKNGSELIKPYLTDSNDGENKERVGRFLLGTVEGDIHDIGKDIVGLVMEINGFEVQDLGVDVPAARFLEAYDEFKPDIVGLSGFLSLAYDPMKEVVEGLAQKGVRDRTRVIIGGGQVDEQVCEYVGADAFATDAVTGLNYALDWMKQ